MKTGHNNNRSTGLPSSMPAVEPKTIVAVVLVASMLVLWGRVLLRSRTGPAIAGAETLSSQTENNTAKKPVRIQAVSLPMLEGRNDRIAADIFNMDEQWKQFDWGQKQNSGQTARKDGDSRQASTDRVVSSLARAVVLEAIIRNIQGSPDKASINGVLVSVGSSVVIMVGDERYTLDVKTIESKQVVLTWQGHTIISKMPDYESGM